MKKEFLEVKEEGIKWLKWCGDCRGAWGNCDGRVKYMSDTYSTPAIKAKVDILNTGKCLK